MWQIAGQTGAVGLEIVLAVVVGWVGGQWLDEKLGTTPWFKWIGLAVGIGAAVNALVRVTRAYKRSLKEDASGKRDPKT
jgi:F0F1-type ATP synthase assembly protein I